MWNNKNCTWFFVWEESNQNNDDIKNNFNNIIDNIKQNNNKILNLNGLDGSGKDWLGKNKISKYWSLSRLIDFLINLSIVTDFDIKSNLDFTKKFLFISQNKENDKEKFNVFWFKNNIS